MPTVIPGKVAATLATQRIVSSLTGTAAAVQYPPNAQALPLGVTIDTVKDTNAAIPVQIDELAYVYFNDTVTCGNLLGADTSGRGVPFSLANTTTQLSLASAYAGFLWDATVALTGTIARILVRPGFDRRAG